MSPTKNQRFHVDMSSIDYDAEVDYGEGLSTGKITARVTHQNLTQQTSTINPYLTHSSLLTPAQYIDRLSTKRRNALPGGRKKLASLMGDDSNELQKIRLSKGLSQQELADKLGCSQPKIHQDEKASNITTDKLFDYARALGVAPVVILNAIEKQKNKTNAS